MKVTEPRHSGRANTKKIHRKTLMEWNEVVYTVLYTMAKEWRVEKEGDAKNLHWSRNNTCNNNSNDSHFEPCEDFVQHHRRKMEFTTVAWLIHLIPYSQTHTEKRRREELNRYIALCFCA